MSQKSCFLISFQVLTAFSSLEARSYRKRNTGGQLSSKITKNKKLKKKKKSNKCGNDEK